MLTACAEWMEKDVERWTTESGLNLPSLCVPVLCDKWSFQKDYTTLHGPLGYHEEYNHTNTEEGSERISINMRLMLKHQQRNGMFFIFTLEKFHVVIDFIPPPWWTWYRTLWESLFWFNYSCVIRIVLDSCGFRGERRSSTCPWKSCIPEKKRHIMQYWLVLKSVW